jgi:hypothetical protein
MRPISIVPAPSALRIAFFGIQAATTGASHARQAKLLHGFEKWSNRYGKSAARYPGTAYYLLHSLSRALIQKIALDCGYPGSSLKERVYAHSSAQGGMVERHEISSWIARCWRKRCRGPVPHFLRKRSGGLVIRTTTAFGIRSPGSRLVCWGGWSPSLQQTNEVTFGYACRGGQSASGRAFRGA